MTALLELRTRNGTFAINKSRRDNMSVERWNNLPILTYHPYGILLTTTTEIYYVRHNFARNSNG
ncbi:MAG: hypothetical protein LBG80_04400 [Bacteroidales bacterium]|nr:hypothetical protein [Bacteroidales bacterium]